MSSTEKFLSHSEKQMGYEDDDAEPYFCVSPHPRQTRGNLRLSFCLCPLKFKNIYILRCGNSLVFQFKMWIILWRAEVYFVCLCVCVSRRQYLMRMRRRCCHSQTNFSWNWMKCYCIRILYLLKRRKKYVNFIYKSDLRHIARRFCYLRMLLSEI